MGAGHHASVYTPTVNIGDNFRTRVMTRSTCQYCSTPRERATDSMVFDLTYRTASDESPVSSKNSSADANNPLRRSSSAHLNRRPAFVDVLCNSMVRETMTKAYCETCQGYKQTLLQRRLTALPDVLAVSCGAMNQAELAIWRHTAQPHTGDPPSGSTNGHTDTAAAEGKARSGPVRTRSVSDGDIHETVFSQGPPEQSQRKDSWLPSGLIASIRDKGLSITADTREEIQRRKLATTTPKHTTATPTHTHTTTPTAPATAHTRPVQPLTQPPQQQQQQQAPAHAHAHTYAQRYAHVGADGDASGKDVRNAEYVLTSVVCTIAGKHGGNVVALVWVDGEYHNRANNPPYVGTRLLRMQSQQAENEPRNTATTPEPHITPIASSGQISERNPAPKPPHKASEAHASVSTATAAKTTSTDANDTTTHTATTTPHTNSTLPKNTNPHTNSIPHTTSTLLKNTTPHTNSTLHKNTTPHTNSTLHKNTTPHTNSTLTGTQANGAQKTASAMKGGWYVFNDFAINPVTEDDAIDFSMVWKVPCLLYYTRAEFVAAEDPIDTKSAHTTANRPMSSTDKHAAAQPKASATDALKDCATSAARRPQRDVQSKAEPNLRTTNANAHTQSNPNISLSLHMSTHTPHTTHETSKGTAATDAHTATPTTTPTVTATPTLGSNTAGSVSDKTLTNTETPSSASAKTETAVTSTANTQTAPSATAQREKSVTADAQTESAEGTDAEISGAADGTTPKTQQPQTLQTLQTLQSDSVGQVVSAEDAATDRPVPTLADQSAGVKSAAPTATTSAQAKAHAHTQQQPQQQQQQQPQPQQSQQQSQQQQQSQPQSQQQSQPQSQPQQQQQQQPQQQSQPQSQQQSQPQQQQQSQPQQQQQQQPHQQSQSQPQQQQQPQQPQPPPQPSYTRFQLIQSKTIQPQTLTAPPPPQVPPNLNIDPTLPTHVQQHPLHKYIPQSAVHKLGAPTAAIRPRTPIEGPTLAERLQRHPQTQAQAQAHPTTATKPQLYLRQITPSGRTSPSNGSGSGVSNGQSTPVNGSVVSADRKSVGRQAAVAGSAGDRPDVNALRAPKKSSKTTVDISLDVFVNDSEYSMPTKFAKAATPHIIVPITSEDTLPARGAKVAIDAEFVALEMEEAAIRSNGAKSTIRPSQLCLARVSVLWAEGTAIGTAFIDDYIYTTEPVTDYLTQFSGINPGDLNPAVSKKHLVSLKTTYLKLRVLADRGCVFVGHGLKKDFRIINMIVPPHQVIDTVELFYMPRQRRVSLRFLAWFLLRMDIQESVHDSVEDARTALFLYEKYKQLEASGMLEETIRSVYDAGRHYKWRAPHWP